MNKYIRIESVEAEQFIINNGWDNRPNGVGGYCDRDGETIIEYFLEKPNAYNKQVTIHNGNWIVTDKSGLKSVYSNSEFKSKFTQSKETDKFDDLYDIMYKAYNHVDNGPHTKCGNYWTTMLVDKLIELGVNINYNIYKK